ncbi:NAD(P)-binding protein [Sphingomonas sp. Leaf67]|uniref:NAD(P)-binding protein n=1 Tax=Sphingomonas sp. Leaf67 TaxID=1736230 RepID=UPI002AA2A014|nr:NAD(P)-binding protein [Sphingomonas sp. Leaf67]
MAGLSCAQTLRHQGHNVIVFDKGAGRVAACRPAASTPRWGRPHSITARNI